MDTNTASRQAGLNVRAEMARKRVSQTALGRHLGMSQAAVSAKLRGQTPFTIDQLASVAALLEVPLETLTEGVAA